MKRILVVEDIEEDAKHLLSVLQGENYHAVSAVSMSQALDIFYKEHFDLVLTDVVLVKSGECGFGKRRCPIKQGKCHYETECGIKLFREIRKRDEDIPVVVMSIYAMKEEITDLFRIKVTDFLPKKSINGLPDSQWLLITLDRVFSHAEVVKTKNAKIDNSVQAIIDLSENTEPKNYGSIRYLSKEMQDIVERINRIAPTDSNVLITGESGTGKELISKAIRTRSTKDGKFVAVNCGAIPNNLIESELFGHVKGAFTGAIGKRQGRFEEADGGTLFLDEIGDLQPDLQVKLLRAIAEGEISRVGESMIRKVNVRLICATNKDLDAEVKAGRFREDLFYRINVINIKVPPLRSRPHDIIVLAKYFLNEHFNTKKTFSNNALRVLLKYHWPGNVRELMNVIERLAILGEEIIGQETLERETPELLANFPFIDDKTALTDSIVKLVFDLDRGKSLKDMEEELTRAVMEKAMELSGGNKTKAAKYLGMERSNFYNQYKPITGK